MSPKFRTVETIDHRIVVLYSVWVNKNKMLARLSAKFYVDVMSGITIVSLVSIQAPPKQTSRTERCLLAGFQHNDSCVVCIIF